MKNKNLTSLVWRQLLLWQQRSKQRKSSCSCSSEQLTTALQCYCR